MKKNFLYVFILVFLLFIEVFIIVSGAYFSSSSVSSGSITLAELDFFVDCEFEKNMSALPNSYVLCDLKLKNGKLNEEALNLIDFYFRMQITAKSGNVAVVVTPILNSGDWFLVDDFFYYKNVVYKNDLIEICNNILIDKNTGNDVQGLPMEVNILFEAIQINAVEDIWGEEILEKFTNF